MKLVITYDVNVDALEKNYKQYLAERKNMLEYYEEIGDLLKKKEYEEHSPWMNFEEYLKKEYSYGIEYLEYYNYIYNCDIKFKNEEEV